MEISKYKPEYENDIVTAISKDPDWVMFTNDDTIDIYRDSLKNGVTYVCYRNTGFCGYVRAFLDNGLAVYVSELYVIPECRNQKIGQSLLERVSIDYSGLDVYALSDEDDYYQKKGYKKIGSVFEIKNN